MDHQNEKCVMVIDEERDAGCGNSRLPPRVPGSHGRGSPASPRPSSRTLWIWMARKAAS